MGTNKMEFSAKDIEKLIKAAHGRLEYLKCGELVLKFKEKEPKTKLTIEKALEAPEEVPASKEELDRVRQDELDILMVTNPLAYERIMEKDTAES